MRVNRIVAAITLLALCSCGDADPEAPVCDATPQLGEGVPFATLTEFGFFCGDLRAQSPAPGVVPYTVAAPLWADFAEKGRYIVLPEGETITFDDGEEWVFPEGTIIIKTFFFDVDRRDVGGEYRIIETRLLVMEEGEWGSYTYVWNEDETEAELTVPGARVTVEFVNAEGEDDSELYLVPNLDQCGNCHVRADTNRVLGLITHQVNFETEIDGESVNQLQWLADQGVFANPPESLAALPSLEQPFGDGSLDERARAYLHGNCSHCHRDGGGAGRSGLSYVAWEDDELAIGVCKIPAAAGAGAGGRAYDIVPGEPENSIVPFRMSSTDPEIKMPEIPNRVPDSLGVDLITEWIASMSPAGCE